MKPFLLTTCLAFCVVIANAQTKTQVNKFEKILKTASTAKDLKDLIDGDVVSAICGLLGGGEVCGILSVTPLNETEEDELEEIRSKYALEQFLSKKGIKPEDFYRKLWEQRKNQKLIDELEFLKED